MKLPAYGGSRKPSGTGCTAARPLAIERVVPEGDVSVLETVMLDIHMLVITGGRERTAAEHGALYEQAGFRLIRVVPTNSPLSLIEGAPAFLLRAPVWPTAEHARAPHCRRSNALALKDQLSRRRFCSR